PRPAFGAPRYGRGEESRPRVQRLAEKVTPRRRGVGRPGTQDQRHPDRAASASRTSDRMISAAGSMSLTLLTEAPAHSGAYSMSPSKSGGAVPMEYRSHSMRSPMVLERWPIEVPSPGLAPRGGLPAACHSAYVLFRSVRWGALGQS